MDSGSAYIPSLTAGGFTLRYKKNPRPDDDSAVMNRRAFIKKGAQIGGGVALAGVAAMLDKCVGDGCKTETPPVELTPEPVPPIKKFTEEIPPIYQAPEPPPSKPVVVEKRRKPETPKEKFWSNPEFFIPHPNGEFSKEERAERTELLKGMTLFHDVGLTFFSVRPNDGPYRIQDALAEADPKRFSYLKQWRKAAEEKIRSFNIPPNALQIDMWLPLPLRPEIREFQPEEFLELATTGLAAMEDDATYGSTIRALEAKIGKQQLLQAILAVARKESQLGKLELHRYEIAYKCFSFSYFHVLMENVYNASAGLRARRELSLTEGQTYHPINGTKLFLAFLIEKAPRKSQEDTVEYLEDRLDFSNKASAEAFATFYNGPGWKPDYMDIRGYFAEAKPLVAELLAKLKHKK